MGSTLRRRDFLKIVGAATAAAPLGCSREPARRLIPYVFPQEDLVPGTATWYATTCRECPAGCGLLAKNRDGRVIKVEGNPLHPVNQGKLCARGQASVQGLYNPDRLRGPGRRSARGGVEPLSWTQAEGLLTARLRSLLAAGRGDRIEFLSELTTGSTRDLMAHWLKELGQTRGPVLYEPFGYEALRAANRRVFGTDTLPSYRLDRADFLLSLGAGFLESWLSPVEHARQFAAFRDLGAHGRHPFVHVGPRLTATANCADLWLPVAPGDEYLVALGLLAGLLDEPTAGLSADQRSAVRGAVGSWTPARVGARCGVDEAVLRRLVRSFARAQRPLVVADGLPYASPHAPEAALAASLLSSLKPGSRETLSFATPSSLGDTARAADLKELAKRAEHGEIDVLLVHRANPVHALPEAWELRKALAAVPLVVSFSSSPDETTAAARLLLPTHTPLECWGDHSPRRGTTGLLQPVMGPVFDTRPLEDVLLSTGRALRGAERFPWADAREHLRASWRKKAPPKDDAAFELFWEECLARGGEWGPDGATETTAAGKGMVGVAFPAGETPPPKAGTLQLTAFVTARFHDGRHADRPWLQELPEPLSMVTWDSWAELHPDTARALSLASGDRVRLTSPWGSVEVSVLPLPTVKPGVVALPLGQSHAEFGRYARGGSADPLRLFPPDTDPATGGLARPVLGVSLERLGTNEPVAHTDGSLYQYDRGLAQCVSLTSLRKTPAEPPEVALPLPQGYDRTKDFYPTHTHKQHRWCMVIDLDRCTGCGACAVACYAENNVAVVGRDQVLKGREMAWLRLQRYFEPDGSGARWLPMLCQHCEEAPCESVCPLFAPHHGPEGLNNQVYNRCFGTRFCLQADPYKVRRFNWFTFTRPKPLDLQLNPDVTVRQKGVMEKCSFCVQRIVEAKANARNESRVLKDGDFTSACAQTCPTDALVFGDLLDPKSKVAKLVKDRRAYQVLGHLNTKPAVIYLKKITETWEA